MQLGLLEDIIAKICNYMNGAVLYYHHLCQRGKDTVVEGELYQGTSKSAEGYGASMVFKQAKEEGLQIEVHFEDGDSSSSLDVGAFLITIKQARSNFTAALFGAGTDADKFARTMRCLGEHHARNEHEWEGGHCEFYPLKHCSCAKCSGDEIKCTGKPYKVKNRLYYPFHSLAYQIEGEKRASQSDVLVHPILGRGHTNQLMVFSQKRI